MNKSKINIEQSWKELLDKEFDKEYFQSLSKLLHDQKQQGIEIYPPGKLIFKAFELCPVDKLKVVILGQDPYHNPGEAMGLCFSVPKGVKVPPSLVNIYKEINADVGCEIPNHGDLTAWAHQGVLLLNASLTVIKNKPMSHSKIGWHIFTDAVIREISHRLDKTVFMLWGNFARTKAQLIDEKKHFVLQSPHPSPLAGGAFFNHRHFSKANSFLQLNGRKPINWQIE